MDIEQKQTETTKKSSLLSKIIKLVLPLGLGIAIIYFLVRDIDPNELWDVMKSANWAILLFSLIFGLLGNTIRAYRWQLLIAPLGYKTRVSNLAFAVYGTYAVNFAIPRAGEIWRCGVVTKQENVPFAKLFGTMILDRILDTITVLTISLVAFLLNMQFFIEQFSHQKEAVESLQNILTSPILYLCIAAVVVGIYSIFRFGRSNKVVKMISELFKNMGRDISSIWKMKTKFRLLAYTIGIWGCYFLYFYITFYAFDFTRELGITAGLIAFALSSISMGIPSNGGMGPWHAAVIAALGLYGVDKLSAMAFATGVFTTQSVWIILCGLLGIAMLAVRSRKAK